MEKIKTDLRTMQKQEAIKRLKILRQQGLLKNVVDDFRKNNLIYYSEQTQLGGVLYWCTQANGANRFVKVIEEFEQEHNATVYHAIHCYTEFGELLNLLYVSDYEEEWQQDRQDLKENYSFCYVVNLDAEIFSEFGSVGINIVNGGLIRIY